MNKTVLLVIWLLIWFYAGIAYVWMNHDKEQLNRIESNISSIANQLQIDIIEVN